MASGDRGSRLVHDSGLIYRTPNVCGGDACVRGTRIMVWLFESYRRQGASEEWILEGYPTLTREDLAAAWDYIERNRAEIDEAIRDSEEGE